MSEFVPTRRETKYTRMVRDCLQRIGHATNAQIAMFIRREAPYVSDTTVHRVTQRLCSDGALTIAPKAADGSLRYDTNTMRHDHFMCAGCDALCDIVIQDTIRKQLSQDVPTCTLNGNLIIIGQCSTCKED